MATEGERQQREAMATEREAGKHGVACSAGQARLGRATDDGEGGGTQLREGGTKGYAHNNNKGRMRRDPEG